jgi:hypothetical protein
MPKSSVFCKRSKKFEGRRKKEEQATLPKHVSTPTSAEGWQMWATQTEDAD